MQLQYIVTYSPADLLTRIDDYPRQLDVEMHGGMDEALKTVHRAIPPYAPQPPNSKYVRTGNLGASLGKSMSGGVIGTPSVYVIRKIGSDTTVGVIGSNWPHYNHYVIGDKIGGGQAWMHAGRWWTFVGVVMDTRDALVKVFERVTKRVTDRLR